ncbi:MAG TPA: aldo/keto reductase [Thermoanaerobaculia bacterium]
METTRLGHTGLQVSRICLGCMSDGTPTWRPWVLDEAASRPFIQRALAAGINFFDTANMYSLGESEAVLGRALKDFARRDEVVIATKVYYPMTNLPNGGGLSRKHVLSSIDASLQRLGTDYVDLYQIHRWDYETPIEETLGALADVVRAGKARYLGASSMFAWQLAKALYLADRHGWPRFVSMQPHYNLLYREEEREMLPLCREEGLGVIPWSPLARGLLTGAARRGEGGTTARADNDTYTVHLYGDGGGETIARVAEVAKARGTGAAQVALAWLLAQPGVTAPIIGATKMEHLEAAIAAVGLRLTDEELKRLGELYRPLPVSGHS